jgi:hypothetical protein
MYENTNRSDCFNRHYCFERVLRMIRYQTPALKLFTSVHQVNFLRMTCQYVDLHNISKAGHHDVQRKTFSMPGYLIENRVLLVKRAYCIGGLALSNYRVLTCLSGIFWYSDLESLTYSGKPRYCKHGLNFTIKSMTSMHAADNNNGISVFFKFYTAYVSLELFKVHGIL